MRYLLSKAYDPLDREQRGQHHEQAHEKKIGIPSFSDSGRSSKEGSFFPNTALASTGGAGHARARRAAVLSRVLITRPTHSLTVRELRTAYLQQVRAATADLRSSITTRNSPTLCQWKRSHIATTGRLKRQRARRRRRHGSPIIQPGCSLTGINYTPGTGDPKLALGLGFKEPVERTELRFHNTPKYRVCGQTSGVGCAAINLVPAPITSQINSFFNTTNLRQAAVNTSGQQIPLNQFLGAQVVNQLGNTLGSLAQKLPSVANSILFPNDVTTTSPTQELFQQFGVQARNALDTAAFQLGSDLALFSGSPVIASQVGPTLMGSTSSSNSIASALMNLPFGTTALNSAVLDELNTGFNSVVSPLNSFFGLQGQTNQTLPTTGLTSLFLRAAEFNTGFNNGFATDTTSGFPGLGVAPTNFNTSFATGFSNLSNTGGPEHGIRQHSPWYQGTVGGVPVQSR